jgi:hypothetical protein
MIAECGSGRSGRVRQLHCVRLLDTRSRRNGNGTARRTVNGLTVVKEAASSDDQDDGRPHRCVRTVREPRTTWSLAESAKNSREQRRRGQSRRATRSSRWSSRSSLLPAACRIIRHHVTKCDRGSVRSRMLLCAKARHMLGFRCERAGNDTCASADAGRFAWCVAWTGSRLGGDDFTAVAR